MENSLKCASSNTTAMIIASQNQDYVDEGLAEYQDQIHKLQNEQDRVQKKTFVNWINSHLSRRNAGLKISDLIQDLKSGVVLLTLLEVLSGCKLQEEKGRVLKRPHFLSNCNTALEFLRTRKIKLVNINASDIVDGRPPVILGLIWTIILYFQIEENTKIYESSSGHGHAISDSRRRSSGWKVGARNALLQWCKEMLTPKFGIHVDNFGSSWRDGRAFVALISALNPDLFVKLEDFEGLLTLHALHGKSNLSRLKIAFLIAEKEFGIYPLLDPEDVDVSSPDEKSIMTYVAQFLNKFSSKDSSHSHQNKYLTSQEQHQQVVEKSSGDRSASVCYTSTTSAKLVHPMPKRPSSSKPHQSNLPVVSKIEQLRAWLTTTNQFFESINLKKDQRRLSYMDYLQFKRELESQDQLYNHLKSLHEESSLGELSHFWKDIDTNWQKVITQLRHLQWILDTALPGELGIIGEWVNQGEAFLMSEDEPVQFNEDSAALLNQKIDDHKQFFENYERTMEQLKQWSSKTTENVPPEQLKSLINRLHLIGPKSCQRGFHLKFLEHKCCILAFLSLTENKLKLWTRKCGNEENVSHCLTQYKAFVSKNKIFQEFQKAFLEFKDVSEDYKNNANLSVSERIEIDKFIEDVSQKWSVISTELQHVQAHLNEVLNNWQQWNSSYAAMEGYLNEAFERFEGDEAQIQLFLEDLDNWKMHYTLLQSTSCFLMTACDESIASNLQQKMAVIHCNWSYLLQYAEKYGSDTLNKASFDEELKKLASWLTRAENSLMHVRRFNTQEVMDAFDEITQVTSEVADMETLFKSLSRRFQALVSEMAMPEIEDTMKVLKSQKEHLVNVRSSLPLRLQFLEEVIKKVGDIEEQMDFFENQVLNMHISDISVKKIESHLQAIEETKLMLQEIGQEGFDVTEVSSELNYVWRHLKELEVFYKSPNREQLLLQKFTNWFSELDTLLESTTSNLLQLVVLQLNIMILMRRQNSDENSSAVRAQIQKTLDYIQGADLENQQNLADHGTKLATDLKILAKSDLEQLLHNIPLEDKQRILAMLDILINLSKECSADIASTYTHLNYLRDKIMSIPVEQPHESSDNDDEEEDDNEEENLAKVQLAKDTTMICNELQEFHGSIDEFLRNTAEKVITLQDIETLASKEDVISTKVRELKEQQKNLDANIQASLNQVFDIIEKSLEAVRLKMYGDFGDQSALTSTAKKVEQMKGIVEGQIKEASEQMTTSNEFEASEVLTHLSESLQTGEEDIVFAQSKLKSRTSSLCKEALAFEMPSNSTNDCDTKPTYDEQQPNSDTISAINDQSKILVGSEKSDVKSSGKKSSLLQTLKKKLSSKGEKKKERKPSKEFDEQKHGHMSKIVSLASSIITESDSRSTSNTAEKESKHQEESSAAKSQVKTSKSPSGSLIKGSFELIQIQGKESENEARSSTMKSVGGNIQSSCAITQETVEIDMSRIANANQRVDTFSKSYEQRQLTQDVTMSETLDHSMLSRTEVMTSKNSQKSSFSIESHHTETIHESSSVTILKDQVQEVIHPDTMSDAQKVISDHDHNNSEVLTIKDNLQQIDEVDCGPFASGKKASSTFGISAMEDTTGDQKVNQVKCSEDEFTQDKIDDHSEDCQDFSDINDVIGNLEENGKQKNASFKQESSLFTTKSPVEEELVGLVLERQEEVETILGPLKDVLDPHLLSTVKEAVNTFVVSETAFEGEGVDKPLKSNVTQQLDDYDSCDNRDDIDSSIGILDKSLAQSSTIEAVTSESFISEKLEEYNASKSSNSGGKSEMKNEEPAIVKVVDASDETLVGLQLAKQKEVNNILFPLREVLDPEVFEMVEDSINTLAIQSASSIEEETENQSGIVASDKQIKAMTCDDCVESNATDVLTMSEVLQENPTIDESMVGLQLGKQKEVDTILSPLQDVLDPEILKIVKDSISAFAIDAISSNDAATSASPRILTTDVSSPNFESPENKELDATTFKNDPEETLVALQLEKQKEVDTFIAPLQEILDPELMNIVKESISSFVIDNSQNLIVADERCEVGINSSSVDNDKENDDETLVNLQMEKQQEVDTILAPLLEVLDPDVMEMVKESMSSFVIDKATSFTATEVSSHKTHLNEGDIDTSMTEEIISSETGLGAKITGATSDTIISSTDVKSTEETSAFVQDFGLVELQLEKQKEVDTIIAPLQEVLDADVFEMVKDSINSLAIQSTLSKDQEPLDESVPHDDVPYCKKSITIQNTEQMATVIEISEESEYPLTRNPTSVQNVTLNIQTDEVSDNSHKVSVDIFCNDSTLTEADQGLQNQLLNSASHKDSGSNYFKDTKESGALTYQREARSFSKHDVKDTSEDNPAPVKPESSDELDAKYLKISSNKEVDLFTESLTSANIIKDDEEVDQDLTTPIFLTEISYSETISNSKSVVGEDEISEMSALKGKKNQCEDQEQSLFEESSNKKLKGYPSTSQNTTKNEEKKQIGIQSQIQTTLTEKSTKDKENEVINKDCRASDSQNGNYLSEDVIDSNDSVEVADNEEKPQLGMDINEEPNQSSERADMKQNITSETKTDSVSDVPRQIIDVIVHGDDSKADETVGNDMNQHTSHEGVLNVASQKVSSEPIFEVTTNLEELKKIEEVNVDETATANATAENEKGFDDESKSGNIQSEAGSLDQLMSSEVIEHEAQQVHEYRHKYQSEEIHQDGAYSKQSTLLSENSAEKGVSDGKDLPGGTKVLHSNDQVAKSTESEMPKLKTDVDKSSLCEWDEDVAFKAELTEFKAEPEDLSGAMIEHASLNDTMKNELSDADPNGTIEKDPFSEADASLQPDDDIDTKYMLNDYPEEDITSKSDANNVGLQLESMEQPASPLQKTLDDEANEDTQDKLESGPISVQLNLEPEDQDIKPESVDDNQVEDEFFMDDISIQASSQITEQSVILVKESNEVSIQHASEDKTDESTQEVALESSITPESSLQPNLKPDDQDLKPEIVADTPEKNEIEDDDRNKIADTDDAFEKDELTKDGFNFPASLQTTQLPAFQGGEPQKKIVDQGLEDEHSDESLERSSNPDSYLQVKLQPDVQVIKSESDDGTPEKDESNNDGVNPEALLQTTQQPAFLEQESIDQAHEDEIKISKNDKADESNLLPDSSLQVNLKEEDLGIVDDTLEKDDPNEYDSTSQDSLVTTEIPEFANDSLERKEPNRDNVSLEALFLTSEQPAMDYTPDEDSNKAVNEEAHESSIVPESSFQVSILPQGQNIGGGALGKDESSKDDVNLEEPRLQTIEHSKIEMEESMQTPIDEALEENNIEAMQNDILASGYKTDPDCLWIADDTLTKDELSKDDHNIQAPLLTIDQPENLDGKLDKDEMSNDNVNLSSAAIQAIDQTAFLDEESIQRQIGLESSAQANLQPESQDIDGEKLDKDDSNQDDHNLLDPLPITEQPENLNATSDKDEMGKDCVNFSAAIQATDQSAYLVEESNQKQIGLESSAQVHLQPESQIEGEKLDKDDHNLQALLLTTEQPENLDDTFEEDEMKKGDVNLSAALQATKQSAFLAEESNQKQIGLEQVNLQPESQDIEDEKLENDESNKNDHNLQAPLPTTEQPENIDKGELSKDDVSILDELQGTNQSVLIGDESKVNLVGLGLDTHENQARLDEASDIVCEDMTPDNVDDTLDRHDSSIEIVNLQAGLLTSEQPKIVDDTIEKDDVNLQAPLQAYKKPAVIAEQSNVKQFDQDLEIANNEALHDEETLESSSIPDAIIQIKLESGCKDIELVSVNDASENDDLSRDDVNLQAAHQSIKQPGFLVEESIEMKDDFSFCNVSNEATIDETLLGRSSSEFSKQANLDHEDDCQVPCNYESNEEGDNLSDVTQVIDKQTQEIDMQVGNHPKPFEKGPKQSSPGESGAENESNSGNLEEWTEQMLAKRHGIDIEEDLGITKMQMVSVYHPGSDDNEVIKENVDYNETLQIRPEMNEAILEDDGQISMSPCEYPIPEDSQSTTNIEHQLDLKLGLDICDERPQSTYVVGEIPNVKDFDIEDLHSPNTSLNIDNPFFNTEVTQKIDPQSIEKNPADSLEIVEKTLSTESSSRSNESISSKKPKLQRQVEIEQMDCEMEASEDTLQSNQLETEDPEWKSRKTIDATQHSLSTTTENFSSESQKEHISNCGTISKEVIQGSKYKQKVSTYEERDDTQIKTETLSHIEKEGTSETLSQNKAKSSKDRRRKKRKSDKTVEVDSMSSLEMKKKAKQFYQMIKEKRADLHKVWAECSTTTTRKKITFISNCVDTLETELHLQSVISYIEETSSKAEVEMSGEVLQLHSEWQQLQEDLRSYKDMAKEVLEEDVQLAEVIAIQLLHIDALLTREEVQALTVDLDSISVMLNESTEKLEKFSIQWKGDDPILVSADLLESTTYHHLLDKITYLMELKSDLESRLQLLLGQCHHAVQVDTLKFEQDVGLQIDVEENDLKKERISELKNSMTKDNLIDTLAKLYDFDTNGQEEITEHLEQAKMHILNSPEWSETVETMIENQDESSMRQVLVLIPSSAPLSKKLKKALSKFHHCTPTDPDLTNEDPMHNQRTRTQRCASWLCRVVKVALPIQAGLLLILGLSSIMPLNREEIICSVQNSFRDSMEPMLQWTNGSPPI